VNSSYLRFSPVFDWFLRVFFCKILGVKPLSFFSLTSPIGRSESIRCRFPDSLVTTCLFLSSPDGRCSHHSTATLVLRLALDAEASILFVFFSLDLTGMEENAVCLWLIVRLQLLCDWVLLSSLLSAGGDGFHLLAAGRPFHPMGCRFHPFVLGLVSFFSPFPEQ